MRSEGTRKVIVLNLYNVDEEERVEMEYEEQADREKELEEEVVEEDDGKEEDGKEDSEELGATRRRAETHNGFIPLPTFLLVCCLSMLGHL